MPLQLLVVSNSWSGSFFMVKYYLKTKLDVPKHVIDDKVIHLD